MGGGKTGGMWLRASSMWESLERRSLKERFNGGLMEGRKYV